MQRKKNVTRSIAALVLDAANVGGNYGIKSKKPKDSNVRYKKKFDIAELALTLEIVPIALLTLRNFVRWLDGYVLLMTLIFMVAGFILGIAALFQRNI